LIRKAAVDGNIVGSVRVSVNDLFGDLTGKQVETLLMSYFMGYFSLPRKASVLKIARTKNEFGRDCEVSIQACNESHPEVYLQSSPIGLRCVRSGRI
jgi:hypothetical protein